MDCGENGGESMRTRKNKAESLWIGRMSATTINDDDLQEMKIPLTVGQGLVITQWVATPGVRVDIFVQVSEIKVGE